MNLAVLAERNIERFGQYESLIFEGRTLVNTEQLADAHRFADMATEIAAARSLTYHALRKVVAGEDAVREVSMAKWLSAELAWKVADEALQVHGGYGYMMEFPAQRVWRDARLGPIGGGTTEVMKEIIGRSYGL